jgi:hypothetical protein
MKIIMALCFIIFVIFPVNAQKTKKVPVKESFIPKIVMRSGWITPVFAENVAALADEGTETIEDVEVQKKHHRLAEEQRVSAEPCTEWSSGTNERKNYAVRDFTTFEYKGRVFAYQVNYLGLVIGENSIQYAMCSRRVVYADENGDGKFELRCGAAESGFVPQWVKYSELTKVSPSLFLKNQTSDESQKDDSLNRITVARSGWTYPLFANDVAQTQEGRGDLIEDVDVKMKESILNEVKYIYFENCNAKYDDEMTANNIQPRFVINSFSSYETRGRIFAYRLSGVHALSAGDAPSGTIAFFLYVDENGDGTFERRCGNINLEPLPQWVKDFGQLKVKSVK